MVRTKPRQERMVGVRRIRDERHRFGDPACHGRQASVGNLEPGQRALVYGSIRILSAPPRNPTPFWVGLIHEDVEIVNPRVDPKWITVDVAPTGPWGERATPTPMVRGD